MASAKNLKRKHHQILQKLLDKNEEERLRLNLSCETNITLTPKSDKNITSK